jgi:hypothetical protein
MITLLLITAVIAYAIHRSFDDRSGPPSLPV